MRYYDFAVKADEKYIKANAKINLNNYSYDSPITALNAYMINTLKNEMSFIAYREESTALHACFSFNEKNETFQNAYNTIIGTLQESFSIDKILVEPYEITTYQCLDNLYECQRRAYMHRTSYFVDNSNLWLYYDDPCDKRGGHNFHLNFEEKIISLDKNYNNQIYDPAFLEELSNIDNHKNHSDYQGNMVHYIISSRSIEAAADMTEQLMQKLYNANRISSKRMSVISEIEPYLCLRPNHLEDIIENNFGGVIILDLTEKFGKNPTDYEMTAKYIENLVKKYRNKCLFVFTYNMDKPGFSYYILPELKKYVMPITLREGTGNRKAAVAYMKNLIKDSEYAKYANQASEYMKQFPGNEFTQTDVLMAYEQFESWCLCKNVLNTDYHEASDAFLLDRDENAKSAYEQLDNMVGLKSVKEQINSIIATDIVEKERKRRKGKDYQYGTMHMIFGGNPGSAKTTVARLFAGIAKEKGILKSGAFVEKIGNDLDGMFFSMKIRNAFEAAKGGVLFVDEAYSLENQKAIATFIGEMENRRDDVIVILSGYNERMHNFIDRNEGLQSRIPYWIDFPDYDVDELTEIFKKMVSERGFSVTEDAVSEARYIFEKARHMDNFGNGRYVRNFIDKSIRTQSTRLLSNRGDASSIRKNELFLITKEDICMLEEDMNANEENKEALAKTETLSAMERLDSMIGLTSVKKVIHKAVANYKLRKLCIDKGISRDKVSLHMVFTGNPGTAKTTVARLFAEIMKDEKVLSSGKFVEVGRADLVGDHVGSTAKLVKQRFKEAQGGVLFIDEAYSLCDYYENSFGDEAISTIVQEMENNRDNVIVIFAGYPEPMKHFLDRNPGMASRIAFHVQFEDYTTDELCQITEHMASEKQILVTEKAMEKLKQAYDSVKENDDYGNGRFVRKMLEEAELNLAERLCSFDESELTKELITTIDACDIPELSLDEQIQKKKIGFI